MGMQTSAVFSLGVRAVFTTATTATLAVLMGDFSRWRRSRVERRRLSSILLALVGGAASGAFQLVHARAWAPALPLALSALAIVAAEVAWERRTFEPASFEKAA
jgi:uncharacterized membrane protein YoaK (UPF0700 family)